MAGWGSRSLWPGPVRGGPAGTVGPRSLDGACDAPSAGWAERASAGPRAPHEPRRRATPLAAPLWPPPAPSPPSQPRPSVRDSDLCRPHFLSRPISLPSSCPPSLRNETPSLESRSGVGESRPQGPSEPGGRTPTVGGCASCLLWDRPGQPAGPAPRPLLSGAQRGRRDTRGAPRGPPDPDVGRVRSSAVPLASLAAVGADRAAVSRRAKELIPGSVSCSGGDQTPRPRGGGWEGSCEERSLGRLLGGGVP